MPVGDLVFAVSMSLASLSTIALSVLAMVSLAVGCTPKPKVDWDARVGHYTFDQAVVELGPPDRDATLADGKRVAEWVVGRSSSGGLTVGFGSFSGSTGVGVSQTMGSGAREKVLRLTFGADGELLTWARN